MGNGGRGNQSLQEGITGRHVILNVLSGIAHLGEIDHARMYNRRLWVFPIPAFGGLRSLAVAFLYNNAL